DRLARGVENGRSDARARGSLAVVLHLRANPDRGFAGAHLGARERAPLLDVHRIGLHQPDVPIDAGALVEPTVALGGVGADQQHVPSAGGGEIGYVEAERIITADVPADVEAVEDDRGFAIRAVELDGDALTGVAGRELED